MSVASSRKALSRAGIDPAQIDCVIVATVSHLLQTPAVATLVSEELGCTPAAAFDISAACAGFCHGVALASDLVRATLDTAREQGVKVIPTCPYVSWWIDQHDGYEDLVAKA